MPPKKARFADAPASRTIAKLVMKADHRLLAVWAADCAKRVLRLFEEGHPGDERPRRAISGARRWARTGVFRMADVRACSLSAHAAAREVEEGADAARFAARSAGHAMATAHVKTHSIAAAWYAAKAAWAAGPGRGGKRVARERQWQHRRLLALQEKARARKMAGG